MKYESLLSNDVFRTPSSVGKIIRSRAPVRLGLAGGGTDVEPYVSRFGGVVLNAAIDRYCYASIRRRDDSVLRINCSDLGFDEEADVAQAADLSEASLFARAAIAELGLARSGFGIQTSSDVPPGTGLGSSSTILVALLHALSHFTSDGILEKYELAERAIRVERQKLGFQGGKQDQFAASFGGFNLIEFLISGETVVHRLRLADSVVRELEHNLVLCFTGVRRASSQIISQQQRRIEAGSPSAIAATDALKENAIKLWRSLSRGDVAAMGPLLHEAWEAKRQLADEVSNDHIDRMYRLALESGAAGGKVSGAGGGGYLMLYAGLGKRDRLVSRLEREGYDVRHVRFEPEGACSWDVALT